MPTKDSFILKAAKLADFVLAAAGILCFLTLLYFAYYYGWTGQRQFTSRIGVLVYYVSPALLALSFFASLRLRPTYRINLALLCLSVAISICAADLLLQYQATRPVDPMDEIVRTARKFGVNHYDRRSKLEVVTDLRKEGINAVPAIIPLGLLRDQEDGTVRSPIVINGAEVIPLSGIANKVTVFCNESGEYTIYGSDEHGFHNPAGIWNSGPVEVAALGDSFTQGMCVPSDENFVARIRKRYPATANLGMSGEGPLLMFAALKEYLPFLRPKVVLWFYFEENDPIELQREDRSRLLMRYLENNFKQDLLSRQSAIDHALTEFVKREEAARRAGPRKTKPVKKLSLSETIVSIVKLGAVRPKLGLVFDRHIQLPDLTGTNVELFREIMSQARATVASWDGTLYFVYLPSWERYGDPDRASADREEVLKIVRSLDIPIIDIHPVFHAHPDPVSLFPFRRWGHYTKEGHRLVGEAVLNSISRKNG